MPRFENRRLKGSRTSLVLLGALLTILVMSLAGVPPTAAATGSYTEDFTTTTYLDAGATNATGWGNGTLHLPYRPPFLVGYYAPVVAPFDVWVVGNYAYVDCVLRLDVLNITNPAQPALLGNCTLTPYAYDLCVSENYAYVVSTTAGLLVINVTDATQPTVVGTCATPGSAWGVTVSGSFAYVADWAGGLQVINVSSPMQPAIVGSCATRDSVVGVAVAGDIAYVAGYNDETSSGLQAINITDPTNPAIVGTCDTPSHAFAVALAGDFAYVSSIGSGDPGLVVVNVSNPAHPSIVGGCHMLSQGWNLVLVGDYAFVARDLVGLQVVNVSDPTHPTIDSAYDEIGNVMGVFVAGDYAYLACAGNGFRAVRVFWYGCRMFKERAVAQSLTVFTEPSSLSLTRANLTWMPAAYPKCTSIECHLSPDNGAHWEAVDAWEWHTFSHTGYQLRWRLVLQTTEPPVSPIFCSVSISYETQGMPPIPGFPWPAILLATVTAVSFGLYRRRGRRR